MMVVASSTIGTTAVQQLLQGKQPTRGFNSYNQLAVMKTMLAAE